MPPRSNCSSSSFQSVWTWQVVYHVPDTAALLGLSDLDVRVVYHEEYMAKRENKACKLLAYQGPFEGPFEWSSYFLPWVSRQTVRNEARKANALLRRLRPGARNSFVHCPATVAANGIVYNIRQH
jgi:hypothetical protein